MDVLFNSGLSRKINSTALKAAALDSLTDCIATSVVIIGLLISASTGVQIDGWLGVCVSLFILLRVSAHSEKAFHRFSAKLQMLNLLMKSRKQC